MKIALAILSIFTFGAAHAQVPTSSHCLPGVTPAPPTFSVASTVGIVSDYTLFCTNTGFVSGPVGSLTFSYFMNVTEIDTEAWTLTQGANTYNGIFAAGNEVQFSGVSYDTNLPTLSFELHGVEVNPSLFPPGFVYKEDLIISGPLAIIVDPDPIQIVAFNADAPEPATLWLCGAALAVTLRRRRR